MIEAGAEQSSYLQDGQLTADIVEELFRASELLYRLAPWKFASEQVIRVDIPRFGLDGACLVIIGEAGEETGFLLFPSIEGYERFCIDRCCQGWTRDRSRRHSRAMTI